VEEEWLAKDPLARVKRPKVDDKPKESLSPAEVDTLLRAVNRGTWLGARNLAAMLLLFSTGMRASELLSLQVSDLDWEKGLITIRRAKGGKTRMVPLAGKAEKALDRYLTHRKRPHGEYVFLTQLGEPMTYDALHQVFRYLTTKTGIKCNPHKWRHSAAIQYLRSGGRVEELRTLLGHSSVEMSFHYARIAGVDLTMAHATADPARSLRIRI
jgi:site-specific recombinase XerD